MPLDGRCDRKNAGPPIGGPALLFDHVSLDPVPTGRHAIATARPAWSTIALSVALGRIATAVFLSHGW
jgi:hypothetical protein